MRRVNITRRHVPGVETPTLYNIRAKVTSATHSSRASFGWGNALEALRWTASPDPASSILSALRMRFACKRAGITNRRVPRTLIATNSSSHRSCSVLLTMKNSIKRAINKSSPQLENMLPVTSVKRTDLQSMLLAYLCSISCARRLVLSPMLRNNRPSPAKRVTSRPQ